MLETAEEEEPTVEAMETRGDLAFRLLLGQEKQGSACGRKAIREAITAHLLLLLPPPFFLRFTQRERSRLAIVLSLERHDGERGWYLMTAVRHRRIGGIGFPQNYVITLLHVHEAFSLKRNKQFYFGQ